jgi:hypothetical protein
MSELLPSLNHATVHITAATSQEHLMTMTLDERVIAVVEPVAQPEPEPDDADVEHLFCDCDAETSLCGLPMPDTEWSICEHDGDCIEICELCERVEADACPKCGSGGRSERRWWQVWR